MTTPKKAPSKTKSAPKPAPVSDVELPAAPSGVVLEPGQSAPAFTLPSSEGRDVSLADFRGKAVVVYFYPKDDTPGCTVEAKDFEAAAAALEARGAVVLGISRDSVETHQRFCTKHGLRFPLLSDRDARVIDGYGAWGEKNMYGKKSMGIVRTTVIVGADGKVRRVFRKVKVAGHVDAVLAALDVRD